MMMVIQQSSRLGSLYALRRRPVLGHPAVQPGVPRFGLPHGSKTEPRVDLREEKRRDRQQYWVSVHRARRDHKRHYGW